MIVHGIDLESAEIRAFCKKWKIKQLSVFGSILRDDFRLDSDVDVLASFDQNEDWDLFDQLDMEAELGGIVGRRVDLLERQAVEKSPNYIRRKHILQTARPIYAQE